MINKAYFDKSRVPKPAQTVKLLKLIDAFKTDNDSTFTFIQDAIDNLGDSRWWDADELIAYMEEILAPRR